MKKRKKTSKWNCENRIELNIESQREVE